MMNAHTINMDDVKLDDLRRATTGPVRTQLSDRLLARVDEGHGVIERALEAGQVVYGVNTGFGKLADRRISADDLHELQRRLIASHMTGVGDDLPDEIVRTTMVLKIMSLTKGHSGVRRVIVEQLAAMLEADLLPVVPAQGSVGASGDLAPLSHLAAGLMGWGQLRRDGQLVDATEGLATIGREPVVLGPKEGVALINGTQVSTALALYGLFAAEQVFGAALTAGALSLDATAGRPEALDARIQEIRGHSGQVRVAAVLRDLVSDSETMFEESPDRRLQDPYCLRCQPQVMGAVHDLLRNVRETLSTEAAAVSDNPLMFPEDDVVLSGGNFHAQPVAFAADILAMALTELSGLSERRTAMLMDASMSGLAPFLVEDAGLNCGYQLAQVTSAALVAENRGMAFPNSVDSIPTSAGQEDHVSMATHAARRLRRMARNAAYVVAIELMSGAQGIDLRGASPAPGLQPAHQLIRDHVAYMDVDRIIAPEIEIIADLVLKGAFSPDGAAQ